MVNNNSAIGRTRVHEQMASAGVYKGFVLYSLPSPPAMTTTILTEKQKKETIDCTNCAIVGITLKVYLD